jgi:2-keto-4-pentenoate hydratase
MDERIERGLARHLTSFRNELRGGVPRLGWKVAFNPRPIQELLRIPHSLIAGLTGSTLVDAGSPHSLAGGTRVALEAEVAVRLDGDVHPDMMLNEVAACVDSWAPAIEIVDFNRSLDDLELILSEGVFHRALRLGSFVAVAPGADLSGVLARVEHAGKVVCELDAREATGHAPEILAHLAGLLAPFGERLSAGDVIILGSMNALTWATPETAFSVVLSGIGAVSVTTTA